MLGDRKENSGPKKTVGIKKKQKKTKTKKIERLGEQSLQGLVRAAERVFNHRETPEEREERVR